MFEKVIFPLFIIVMGIILICINRNFSKELDSYSKEYGINVDRKQWQGTIIIFGTVFIIFGTVLMWFSNN